MRGNYAIFLLASLLVGCAQSGTAVVITPYLPNMAAHGLVPPDDSGKPVVPFDDRVVETFACFGATDIQKIKDALNNANPGPRTLLKMAVAAGAENPTQAARQAADAFADADNQLSKLIFRILHNHLHD